MGKRTKAATVLAKKKQKLEEKKLNPFEIRVNRKKHHVLGQKSKSDRGLPGVSRSRAILKRKKTLLLEYKQRNKSNQFIDRRFGEYDEGLAPEEKMMRRFVLEKQRKHERSSAYNLDEEDELTHYGQSLGDMESFDDVQLSEEEMEEEDIAKTHFGGFLKKKKSKQLHTGEESERPKTRKEVMEEIVTKSKAMKYERQSEKREIDNLMDKLDSEWKEMQKSIPSTKDAKDTPKSADTYDMVVRELAFERRGKPTDRLKSEEEMARDEKERLEKLEAGRIQRMKGLAAAESMEHISADYISERPSLKKDERTALYYKDGRMVLPEAERSDDDGSEGSEVSAKEDSEESGEEEEEEEGSVRESSGDEEESVGEDLGGIYGSDLESDGGEDDQEADESEEEEDEDPDEMLLENRAEEEEEGGGGVSCVNDETEVKEKAARELPYTFEVPRNLHEFYTIVDERSPEECLTAIERIHTCNHPSLSLENKFKLQRFFGVLVEYCLCLGEKPTTAGLTMLDKLARPLFKLAQIESAHTAVVLGGVLRGAHKRWRRRHNLYPPFSDILLFKLIGLLFPTSDYKHCVVTPAMLFMGQLLLKCQIRSVQDLLFGLLVSQMIVEYVSLSKRFVPELVNFVTSVLGYFSRSKDCMLYPPFATRSKLRNELSSREESANSDTSPEHPLRMLAAEGVSDGGSPITHQTKVTILNFALELALQLTELYAGLPSFPEIFTPITTSILRLSGECWPRQIQELCTRVVDGVATHAAAPRPVLQLLKQKPKSIKFYEPKFDQVYEVGRKRARNKVTGERDKLKHKVKREMKGAVREIRKDNVFLAKEKLRETLERDAERERKTKQILHDLQTMQHEAKIERIKKRK